MRFSCITHLLKLVSLNIIDYMNTSFIAILLIFIYLQAMCSLQLYVLLYTFHLLSDRRLAVTNHVCALLVFVYVQIRYLLLPSPPLPSPPLPSPPLPSPPLLFPPLIVPQLVAEKVQFALSSQVKVIVCVGELLPEREAGKTEEVVSRQIAAVAGRFVIKGKTFSLLCLVVGHILCVCVCVCVCVWCVCVCVCVCVYVCVCMCVCVLYVHVCKTTVQLQIQVRR